MFSEGVPTGGKLVVHNIFRLGASCKEAAEIAFMKKNMDELKAKIKAFDGFVKLKASYIDATKGNLPFESMKNNQLGAVIEFLKLGLLKEDAKGFSKAGKKDVLLKRAKQVCQVVSVKGHLPVQPTAPTDEERRVVAEFELEEEERKNEEERMEKQMSMNEDISKDGEEGDADNITLPIINHTPIFTHPPQLQIIQPPSPPTQPSPEPVPLAVQPWG